MFENEMHLSFKGISQNEAFARTVAAAFCTQLNPTLEELTDIRTAVSEAVTNAIIHGYDSRGGTVYIDGRISGRSIEFVIRDEGKGIENVALAMQPFYTSAPYLERSGMGFAVMEAFMDCVTVESAPGKGTLVRMSKYIAKDEQ